MKLSPPGLRLFTLAVVATGSVLCASHARAAQVPDTLAQPPLPPSQLELIRTSAGYLGVDIRDVDETRAQQLKLKDPQGAEVIALDHDAPACKAGMHLQDVITALNGKQITNADQLRRVMRDMPAGKPVVVTVNRAGKQTDLKLRLADREVLARQAWNQRYKVRPTPHMPGVSNSFFGGSGPMEPGYGPLGSAGSHFHIGVMVQALPPQLAEYFGVTDGSGLLVAGVEPKSPAEEGGLKAGDVLLKVNGKALMSPMELTASLQGNAGKTIQLTVLRNHHEQTVSVAVKEQDAETLLFPEQRDERALPALGRQFQSLREPATRQEDLARMQQELAESQKQMAQLDWKAIASAQEEARKALNSIELPAVREQMEEANRTLREQLQHQHLPGEAGSYSF